MGINENEKNLRIQRHIKGTKHFPNDFRFLQSTNAREIRIKDWSDIIQKVLLSYWHRNLVFGGLKCAQFWIALSLLSVLFFTKLSRKKLVYEKVNIVFPTFKNRLFFGASLCTVAFLSGDIACDSFRMFEMSELQDFRWRGGPWKQEKSFMIQPRNQAYQMTSTLKNMELLLNFLK